MYLFFADIIFIIHFMFIVFVVVGGIFVLRRPWLAIIHLPCTIWGAAIEIGGWICPLTPLENYLRRLGGGTVYSGGFVNHYLVPLIYPENLGVTTQYILAAFVIIINLVFYILLIMRRKK
ncbi:MAG: DUF2784 domain-containing protein [Smithella sp.]